MKIDHEFTKVWPKIDPMYIPLCTTNLTILRNISKIDGDVFEAFAKIEHWKEIQPIYLQKISLLGVKIRSIFVAHT